LPNPYHIVTRSFPTLLATWESASTPAVVPDTPVHTPAVAATWATPITFVAFPPLVVDSVSLYWYTPSDSAGVLIRNVSAVASSKLPAVSVVPVVCPWIVSPGLMMKIGASALVLFGSKSGKHNPAAGHTEFSPLWNPESARHAEE